MTMNDAIEVMDDFHHTEKESICSGSADPLPLTPPTPRQGRWSFRLWMAAVTVEPVLLLHNFATQLVWVASQDLMIEKACKVNFDYGDAICDDLKNHDAEEVQVQDLVSQLLTYRSVLETSIKLVTVLALGSWSDRHGRRGPLLLSLLGLLLEAGVQLGLSLSPETPLEYMLIPSVPYALSGGSHALLMLAFSHIADNSGTKTRTTRMGLLDAAYYLGSPLGSLAVGPMLDAGGYVAAYALAISLYAVSILYVIVRIHKAPSAMQLKPQDSGTCGLEELISAISTTMKRRPGRTTAHILALIGAMMLDSMPVWGESGVKYLFVQRALGWDHTTYGRWSSLGSFLSVAGIGVGTPLLGGLLGVADGWLGVIGAASRTTANILYGFVTRPDLAWLMWTGAVASCLKNLAPISIRSMLSKLAGPQDIGRVYAVMAVGETLVPFVSAPMYNNLYAATNDTHPSAYNFLSAGINTLMGTVILGVMLSMKRVDQPHHAIIS